MTQKKSGQTTDGTWNRCC